MLWTKTGFHTVCQSKHGVSLFPSFFWFYFWGRREMRRVSALEPASLQVTCHGPERLSSADAISSVVFHSGFGVRDAMQLGQR